ncbi:MAG: hypothetical protein D6B25_16760 [Desulfobulbaceae bacterium]|nr:MAG: hypothetical protein D6B25_16760 [Desulfobulbaceae bacterium]
MNPYNPHLIDALLEEQRQDILQEAERLRLVRAYEAANPTPKSRLLIFLGNLLIQAGERLKRKYERDVQLPTCRP